MGPALRADRIHPRSHARSAVLALAIGLVGTAIATHVGGGTPQAVGAPRTDATIVAGSPATLDPARTGDAGSSAIIAQLFESLTAFDTGLNLRPALASDWQVHDGGRRVLFNLRPGLTFSDGSPLESYDVIRSWLRIIDPNRPSPLASLISDVEGAMAYARGELTADDVGLVADGPDRVWVRLNRPAADFPAIVAGPTFGIVPDSLPSGVDVDPAEIIGPAGFVGSGAYTLVAQTEDGLTLVANRNYWAGAPALRTIRLVHDLGGESPVEAFEAGEVDYTPIAEFDAGWVAYDPGLGPQLRQTHSLSVDYYGFDTRRLPFDDVDVRRAFALAVDWPRIVRLAAPDTATPATSMVPAGVPGRSDRAFGQRRDPAAARAALARAGFPGGKGFPEVTLVTGGSIYDAAVVDQLRDALGITVRVETMPFNDYFARLAEDPPAFWGLGWVADYPGHNDFLGILLGSGETNNFGRWSSPEFDAAIAAAKSAEDPALARSAYERAESVVQRDVPVIPVSYGTGWALARDGLLGAEPNGLGILRMAGLAWESP